MTWLCYPDRPCRAITPQCGYSDTPPRSRPQHPAALEDDTRSRIPNRAARQRPDRRVQAGAVIVGSSTMCYPTKSDSGPLPDLGLLAQLVSTVTVPVIAERGYSTDQHIRDGLAVGAHAVLIGSAIVDPFWLTRRVVGAFAW